MDNTTTQRQPGERIARLEIRLTATDGPVRVSVDSRAHVLSGPAACKGERLLEELVLIAVNEALHGCTLEDEQRADRLEWGDQAPLAVMQGAQRFCGLTPEDDAEGYRERCARCDGDLPAGAPADECGGCMEASA